MNQSGRSMVEMLGVLAIIGVLSVGGIAGYSKAMYKYKVNKFTDQMTNIIANVRASFGVQKSVEGLNNENIRKMGLVPEGMYTKPDYPDNPYHNWGGQINFGAASYYEIINNYPQAVFADKIFYIATNSIPKDVCITMLTADWGVDLYGIGGGFFGNAPSPSTNDYRTASEDYAITGDKDYPAPFSLTRAEKVCEKADKVGSTGKMTLFWYFKL